MSRPAHPGRSTSARAGAAPLLALAALLLATACSDGSGPGAAGPNSPAAPQPAGPGGAAESPPPAGGSVQTATSAAPSAWYLVGAGDIATCASADDEATATLLDGIVANRASGDSITVFAAGDNVYDNATAAEYANCYEPTWGRHKARTYAALGNHEYAVSPTPTYDYFDGVGQADGRVGPRGKGYYSFELGTWHIIVLNDNISAASGSAQELWLKADLAATTQPCVAAIWHQPRFYSTNSTTSVGRNDKVYPFWVDLYAAGADLVINGHLHMYERFNPQDQDSHLDAAKGIREFIVGTGGKSADGTPTVKRTNSAVRNGTTFGVLKLALGASSYTWEFVPVAGQTFTDASSAPVGCHGRPAPVNSAPTAAFTSSCTDLACTFTDQSTDADGSVTGRSWNFGDGSPASTDQSPPHTYAAAGTYTVTLTATDNGGATNSTSHQVTVQAANTAPAAAFTVSCTDLTCAFTDQSTDGDGSVASWSWSFGDSDTSTARSPSHTYASGGTYTVTLTVTDDKGATGTKTQEVTPTPANKSPVAGFTPSCTNLACTFTDNSTDADGTVTARSWTFGDNGTSTAQSPSHTYTAGGTYTVTLTVTDDDGATGSTSQQVTVQPANTAPKAGFTVSCTNLACTLTDQSTDADGTVTGWSWTFGDNGTSTAQSPTHTYAAGGTYTVTLTATDDDGATNSASQQVSVQAANVLPTASFTVACTNLACNFTDGSSDSDGSVTGWSWNFGDGSPASTAQSPSHTFAAAGTYTVSLTVTDNRSGTGSTTKQVTVQAANALPTASFTVSCAGLACNFTDRSSDPDGTVASRSWSFGDGGTSTAQSPSHTFAAAGTFTATLTVTDDRGGTATSSQSVTVRAIQLSASPFKVKGVENVTLSWSGANGASVVVYRGTASIQTTSGSSYTDNIGAKGAGSYTYQICPTGTARGGASCSNAATVTF